MFSFCGYKIDDIWEVRTERKVLLISATSEKPGKPESATGIYWLMGARCRIAKPGYRAGGLGAPVDDVHVEIPPLAVKTVLVIESMRRFMVGAPTTGYLQELITFIGSCTISSTGFLKKFLNSVYSD